MPRRLILDASSNNGRVDFAAAKRLNPDLVGAILKTTEGNGYVNPLFAQQYNDARAAGLLTGVYTFDRPSAAGTGDMDLHLRTTGDRPMELGHWADCESSDKLDPGTVNARFHEDVGYLATRVPKGKTGIYTGRWFWDPQTRGSGWAAEFPAWIANYSGPGPNLPFPWTAALIWQFTDKLPIAPGVTCDASVWTGTDAQWTALTGGAAPTPPGPNPLEQTWRETQQIVHATVDGAWGPDTDRRCESLRAMRDPVDWHNDGLVRAAQATLQVAVDGSWGPASQSSWTSSVKKLQRTWVTTPDGIWGAGTDTAYLRVSPTR